MKITILGIESSCDDTSAAIVEDGFLLSNITANQTVHKKYGGVVPELASRAHQANIIPVVDTAIKEAGINASQINAVAFTAGPGLMGSLHVGVSFAKGFALAKNIPLIKVNHLQGHIEALFLKEKGILSDEPKFPFLALLVSGGHTQIIVVENHFRQTIIGQTIDDAAGEAFDKCAKVMGLGYPGGPIIDRNAKEGNPSAYKFSKPQIAGLDFSFSGLKTSFLYFIREKIAENPMFIKQNINDICASIQNIIIKILVEKIQKAVEQTGIREIILAGGVSANSGLRNAMLQMSEKNNLKIHLPKINYTTDNAAMIAITGYFKYLQKDFVSHDVTPEARMKI
jgi:N6-L-threonylcarbamoyladenine synthase